MSIQKMFNKLTKSINVTTKKKATKRKPTKKKINKEKITLGACGRSCKDCQFYNKLCKGCRRENKRMSKHCVIYKCVKNKNIESCLKCPTTIPKCRKIKMLSVTYCPVVANLKLTKLLAENPKLLPTRGKLK